MADAVEMAIGGLAVRQHGHVTRRQLLDLGLGEKAINYRLRAGRIHRVHPGVYAVGYRRRAPIALAAAAVLACGPGAVLSHLSAAALWRFTKWWPKVFEVTLSVDRRPKGIKTHRTQSLIPRDTTRQEGILVTTPARTVLDCAPGLPDRQFTRLVNEGLVSSFLKPDALADVLERNPTHPGRKRLTPYADGTNGYTRSDLEDDFVAFIKRFKLPMPELNVPLNGRVVDALFRDERLIVELDSYQFHRHRPAFEKDRDKDADAVASGLETIRITKDRMANTAEREARRLEAILRARRPRRPRP